MLGGPPWFLTLSCRQRRFGRVRCFTRRLSANNKFPRHAKKRRRYVRGASSLAAAPSASPSEASAPPHRPRSAWPSRCCREGFGPVSLGAAAASLGGGVPAGQGARAKAGGALLRPPRAPEQWGARQRTPGHARARAEPWKGSRVLCRCFGSGCTPAVCGGAVACWWLLPLM